MEEKKSSAVVVSREYNKSNLLIGSKYKSSLLENKILAYALYKIKDRNAEDGNLVCSIPATELIAVTGSNKGSFYQSLERCASQMTGRTVGMSDPERKIFHYMAVVTDAKYSDGIFTIEFNRNLRQYLANIGTNYTRMNIDIQMSFESNFSFRLWELLRSEAWSPKGKNEKKFTIGYSLSELKLLLGIVNANLDNVKSILNNSPNPDFEKAVKKSPERTFDRWSDFKARVLDVAVKEINEKTNMHIEYDLLKKGRGGKVYFINFIVTLIDEIQTEKKPKELTPEEKEEFWDYVSDLMKDYGLSYKDVKALAEASKYDYDILGNAYEVMMAQPKEVDDAMGFMIAAMKCGYELNSAQQKRSHERFVQAKDKLVEEGMSVDYEQINLFDVEEES